MADCTYPKCKDAAGCKGACRDLMGEVRRATDGQRAGVPEGVSLRTAANMALDAIHECKPAKGAEKQVSDAIRALRSALDADRNRLGGATSCDECAGAGCANCWLAPGCNCPSYGKRDESRHAPNCPYRLAAAPTPPAQHQQQQHEAAQGFAGDRVPEARDFTSTTPPAGDAGQEFDPLDFGAELYRAHTMKVLAEVEAIAKERTDAHWAGFQNAIEEVRHRLGAASIAGEAIDAAIAASKGE